MAGLLAYFIGAAVRVYHRPEELCSLEDADCRIRVAVEHPPLAFNLSVTGSSQE